MKNVKVRVAVAVDPTGGWSAMGSSVLPEKDAIGFAAECVEPGEVYYWLNAELPIPEIPEIEAEVTPA